MHIISGILEALFGTFFQFGSAFVSDNFIEGKTKVDEVTESESSVEDESEEPSSF